MGFSQKSAVVLRQSSRIDSIVKELDVAHHYRILRERAQDSADTLTKERRNARMPADLLFQ